MDLLLIPRLFLGAVFLMAAIPKLAAPGLYADSVASYRILPRGPSRIISRLLPYAEFILALWLLSGYAVWLAAFGSLGLLTLFVLVTTQAVLRRLDLECSCFGLLYRERVSWRTVGRDAVLTLICLPLALSREASVGVFTLISSFGSGWDFLRMALLVAVVAGSVVLGYRSRGVPRTR